MTIRLFDRYREPTPPVLTVRVAQPDDATLVKGFIREHHPVLRNAPPGYRVAHVLTDDRGSVWGVATWGRPVARLEDQTHTLELTRACVRPGAPDGALLDLLREARAHIARTLPTVRRLITYQDGRDDLDSVYGRDGWRVVYDQQPNGRATWRNRPGRKGTELSVRTKWERKP